MAYDDDRPFRLCESCGAVDQAPRHVYGQGPGDAPTPPDIAKLALKNAGDENFDAVLALIRDDSSVYKHMDCCAADGCPTGECDQTVAAAEGKQNEELVEFITGGGN